MSAKTSYGCVLVCSAAAAFFGGMVFVSLNPYSADKLKKLMSLLTPDQTQVYKEVSRERMYIYLMGLVLGLLLGFIYLYHGAKTVGLSRTCGFVFITMATTYLFYLLYPKSKYMLTYLTTDDQRAAWLDVYRGMQYRHYMGMVLGVIAYVLVSTL
jgi:uncharacterized protein YacL